MDSISRYAEIHRHIGAGTIGVSNESRVLPDVGTDSFRRSWISSISSPGIYHIVYNEVVNRCRTI